MTGTLVAVEGVLIYFDWFHRSPHSWLAMDYDYYRALGQTWLTTGAYYLPEQLSGPYVQTTMVHNAYPPHALLLFVPFIFLPAALWWAIPVGIVAYVLRYLRPPGWVWIVILALIAWPRSIAGLITGNTDMWIAAFIAAGIRWGWPALAVSLKPSFAPLVLLGFRRPTATAIGAVLLLALMAAGFPLWVDYATVLGNVSIDPAYSFNSIPLILVPLVAWATSTRSSPLARWRAPKPSQTGPMTTEKEPA